MICFMNPFCRKLPEVRKHEMSGMEVSYTNLDIFCLKFDSVRVPLSAFDSRALLWRYSLDKIKIYEIGKHHADISDIYLSCQGTHRP